MGEPGPMIILGTMAVVSWVGFFVMREKVRMTDVG